LFLGLNSHLSHTLKKLIVRFTLVGVLLFSGSIYLLATDSMNSFDFKIIGFVTPIGGFLLIVAWGLLMLHFLKKKA